MPSSVYNTSSLWSRKSFINSTVRDRSDWGLGLTTSSESVVQFGIAGFASCFYLRSVSFFIRSNMSNMKVKRNLNSWADAVLSAHNNCHFLQIYAQLVIQISHWFARMALQSYLVKALMSISNFHYYTPWGVIRGYTDSPFTGKA